MNILAQAGLDLIRMRTFSISPTTLPLAVFCLLSLFLPEPVQSQKPVLQECRIQLDDVSAAIDFQHDDGSYGQYLLTESMSAGLALFDYDNDGDQDVFLLNGAPVSIPGVPLPATATPRSNALFRNEGDFRFTNVTEQAGLSNFAMSLGVAVADYDNDGYTDIFLNNFGHNVLYHNRGDGTFVDQTQLSGADTGALVGGGASFLDKDGDGDLDLYIGNYIQLNLDEHKLHFHKGLPAHPSPLSFEPEVDFLLENLGNGVFRDVSAESGIRAVTGRSMGLVSFDYDQDGDIDVFVANDTQENFLLENNGTGVFEEVALLAGVAFDYSGKPQASMGVEVCDLDRDGLLDLVVTSFSEEFTTFYKNEDGFFSDASLQIGASAATFPHVTWGVVSEDFDNDGWLELLIGTGALDDQRQARGGASTATDFRIPNLLLRMNATGRLEDLKQDWGSGAAIAQSARGIVAADLDQDGKVDAIALNARDQITLMRNRSVTDESSSLSIQLVGTTSNRDALGATIRVEQQGRPPQVEQIRSGHSYQSDLRGSVHFGVLAEKEVKITLTWPSGKKEELAFSPDKNSLLITEQN